MGLLLCILAWCPAGEAVLQPVEPSAWEAIKGQLDLFAKVDTLDCEYVDMAFASDEALEAYVAGGAPGRFVLKGRWRFVNGGRIHRTEQTLPDPRRSDAKANRYVWKDGPSTIEWGSPGRVETFDTIRSKLDIRWEPEQETRRLVRRSTCQAAPPLLPFQFLGWDEPLFTTGADSTPLRVLQDAGAMKQAFCRLVPSRDLVEAMEGGFRLYPQFRYAMMGNVYTTDRAFVVCLQPVPAFGGQRLITAHQGMLGTTFRYEPVPLGRNRGETIPLVTRAVGYRRIMEVTRIVLNASLSEEALAIDHALAKDIYDHTARMKVEP